MPAVLVERRDADSLPVILLGLCIPAAIDAAQSTQHVVLPHVGVALQGTSAVDLSSLIILEVEFGQPAIEVWLCLPRLGVYDQIEALDGQHIVLIIEGITSHEQHAVGIDLCLSACACNEQQPYCHHAQ